MRLEGIHHVTAITADAQGNVDFYAGVLGLRLVKKSVNQDDTSVYHLFYADEEGIPGSDITFFEYPGVRRGRAGAGMVHRVVFRVASREALNFWIERLGNHGLTAQDLEDAIVFDDPEGLTLELCAESVPDQPLIAKHPEIPPELALQGLHAVRAYASDPDDSRPLLQEGLNFSDPEAVGPEGRILSFRVRGQHRGGSYLLEPAPEAPGLQGAGTVHHVAFASPPEDHEAWRETVITHGGRPTPIIDRFYFRSIYFREPSGVLFEIATIGPGFDVDEPLDQLGTKLSLTPQFEHLRDQIEPHLTPLRNPRERWDPAAVEPSLRP
ncbi:MAG: glyoxalase family protein [Actinomycetota bacterium]|nr:glyoxalase family protein [Actinomycetota bacterium]